MYLLESHIVLPISLDQAWQFFSKPQNLSRITPPELRLELRHPSDELTFPGQIIEYTVRALPGWSAGWVTEITHCHPPYLFVDEQRYGPYRFWHHLHRFEAMAEGVRVTDKVHYLLPPYPGASLLHRFYIRPQLEHIFAFRKKELLSLFSPVPAA